MSKALENRIKDILNDLPSSQMKGLKELFWEELNYNHDNSPVSKSGWTDDFSNLFINTPVSFATCASNEDFHILYFHLNTDKFLISTERQIVNKLITDYPFSLFVFSNRKQDHWHFVNAIQNQDNNRSKQFILRRISVSKEDRLRTASERIARLDVSLVEAPLLGVSPFQIQKLHEEAFNVEAVTEEFFAEYKDVFKTLMTELNTQSADKIWAHDFALQFMNRLMFIYYIERKRWLGEDPDFLHNFWREYLKSSKGSDRFVAEWLNVLFFEAFNKQFSAGRADHQHIPEKYRQALQLAPYLNGGLFSTNELDEKHIVLIKDNLIGRIMEFLDKYNFTISEDTPLDQEVAVDPEMIGKVYESLVNVSAEADEQSDAGIFYTPRIEIDLMSRLSLVGWLSNHLPEVSKDALYELVFAFSPDDKQDADRTITELGLWPKLEELISGITVLDPACGSGSFLVGMLGILDDLLVRSNQHLGKAETPYERRKRIIGTSLYGVDIMDWAVHVAELRLWLQLVIETELDLGERISQALLPNLSFKLRQGDSLVQEVGGLNLSLHRQGGQLNRSTAIQLGTLKAEKLKYFQNDHERKYRTKGELAHAEFLLFEQIIADQVRTLESRKLELESVLNPKQNLFGEVQPSQMDLDSPKRIQELALVDQNLASLQAARHVLHTQKSIPFVWDVAFVEIFEGERGGFDIVIGNPPYTRQEAIRDLKLPEEISNILSNKKAYKAKIATSVYNAWPRTFGYKPGSNTVEWNLSLKSDLYVFFYFISLSLLSPQGVLSFITSNAWVDVEYGADLQKFLLSRSQIKFVIDNKSKRSFKNAAINTIITLFAPGIDGNSTLGSSLSSEVRFVLFKVPFEETLSPVFWEEIDETRKNGRNTTEEYRVLIESQDRLLSLGINRQSKEFTGGKWGGYYLRAPDIFRLVMQENKEKLSPLSNFVKMSYGIKPGAVKFFYITESIQEKFGIEDEFLLPIITSSQSLKGHIVKPDCFLLSCNQPKTKLRGKAIFDYITFGEKQGIDKGVSVRGHLPYWYSVSGEPFDVLLLQFWAERFWVPYSVDNTLCSNNFFYGLIQTKSKPLMTAILNTSFHFLQLNVLGRVNQGQGVLTTYGYEYDFILSLDPNSFDEKGIITASQKVYERGVLPISDEIKTPERIELDSYVFSALKMTGTQIDDFYNKLIDLVENRKAKAGSL